MAIDGEGRRNTNHSIETWIAIAGLTGYLGLTEFLPQKLNARQNHVDKGSV